LASGCMRLTADRGRLPAGLTFRLSITRLTDAASVRQSQQAPWLLSSIVLAYRTTCQEHFGYMEIVNPTPSWK
jgi:hypothetical protein